MNLTPPAVVKGLTVLNRDLFRQVYSIPAARVPTAKVGGLRGSLERDLVLSWPRVKTVLPDPADAKQSRLLLLNPERILIEQDKFTLQKQNGANEDKKEEEKNLGSNSNNSNSNASLLSPFEAFEAVPLEYDLILDYSYWNTDEVLRAVLPEGIDVPGSFETVGHIAHLNLRPEQAPFKHLIGAVILDKNPAIRTVVNKVGAIESTFRFFQMELLAGVDEMTVEVREEGCVFRFDYSRVYWNSRLQHEHRRLVQLFRPGERVCDLFCGVGPFAVPAAKKGCQVWANDLNPASIEFLTLNRRLNKIPESNLRINNGDARDYVKKSHELLNSNSNASSSTPEGREELFFDHYVMNLPASAHEFLDAFDCIRAKNPEKPPRVHCYVFCRADESPQALVEGQLGTEIGGGGVDVHLVRNVAPNKDMYCVHFDLPGPDTSKRVKIEQQQQQPQQQHDSNEQQ